MRWACHACRPIPEHILDASRYSIQCHLRALFIKDNTIIYILNGYCIGFFVLLIPQTEEYLVHSPVPFQ